MPNIRIPSARSLFIATLVEDNALSSATGFVVSREGKHFLITNRHVVTGTNLITGKPLSTTGGLPNELRILHNKEGALGAWIAKTEALTAGSSPLWHEHPSKNESIDVVALELTDLGGTDIHAYDPWSQTPDIALGPADELSIIGFPFGVSSSGFPIWIKGAVATEPEVNHDGLPCFLIDSRTRPGQSGSPVIFYSAGGGTYRTKDGITHIGGGEIEQFCGVYSGRINRESDIGYVWKPQIVTDIIDQALHL